MLKIIILLWHNIKRFFTKHTLMALLLLFGIIVTSTALNVYYAQSDALANTVSGYTGINRILDYSGNTGNDYSTVYDFFRRFYIRGGDDIDFICAMNTQSENIDLIGIEAKEARIHLDTGEWVSDGKAVVPCILNGKEYNIGDEITVLDSTYTVCGTYMPDNYSASLFSSRRISLAEYAATGIEKDESLTEKRADYDYGDRAALGIFITYDNFLDMDISADLLRVRFISAISQSQKESMAESFSEYLTDSGFNPLNIESIAMDASKSVYTVQFISKFAIYLLIIALSFINNIALFLFVLKCNKHENSIFMTLGATKGRIALVSCMEFSIYIILSYTVGFFIAKRIVQKTVWNESVSYIGLKSYLIILTVLIAISCTFIAIYLIREYGRKQPDNDESILPLHLFAKKAGLKNTYLVFCNYSKNILSEVIIMLQVMFVAFSFSYCSMYYFERNANNRAVDKYFGDKEVFIVEPSSRVIEESYSPFYGFNGECTETGREFDTSVKNLSGNYDLLFEGSCIISLNETEYTKEHNMATYITARSLSPSLIKDYNWKISEGIGLDEWQDGVDYNEMGYIPIVVSRNMLNAFDLKCGEVFKAGYTVSNEYMPQLNFKIIGVLDNNSKFFLNGQVPITVKSVLYDTFNWTEIENQVIVLTPQIYINGNPVRENSITSQTWPAIVCDDDSMLNEWREELKNVGKVHDLREIAKAGDSNYIKGTNEYDVHLIITSALLVIGVAGYNLLSLERNRRIYGIYFSCGMPWRKAIGISLISNCIIFISGGIIGAMWGVLSAQSVRPMARDTVFFSGVTSVVFVIALFVLTFAGMFINMSKINPISLIKKGE